MTTTLSGMSLDFVIYNLRYQYCYHTTGRKYGSYMSILWENTILKNSLADTNGQSAFANP